MTLTIENLGQALGLCLGFDVKICEGKIQQLIVYGAVTSELKVQITISEDDKTSVEFFLQFLYDNYEPVKIYGKRNAPVAELTSRLQQDITWGTIFPSDIGSKVSGLYLYRRQRICPDDLSGGKDSQLSEVVKELLKEADKIAYKLEHLVFSEVAGHC